MDALEVLENWSDVEADSEESDFCEESEDESEDESNDETDTTRNDFWREVSGSKQL